MLTRRAMFGVALAIAPLAISGPAWSQNFTKQVHIIVPYAPGGTRHHRASSAKAGSDQPVIVENKPSSSGNIGADRRQSGARRPRC